MTDIDDIDDIDIGARLRAGDPLRAESALSAMSPGDVDAMRRVVFAAAERSVQSPAWWPPLVALVATAAAMVIAVVGARVRDSGRPASTPTLSPSPVADSASTTSTGRRQLQFATPGGTRVIWVFDPEFSP